MSIKEVKIEKLEYPYNIQTRQGMYGSSGENADILFRELVDNTIDLSLKFRTPVSVKSLTNKSGWNAIVDDGLGMPLYTDPDFSDEEQPIIIDMMRKVNVGSNFHKTEYSIGQNGIGSRLTQALSDEFIIIVNAKKKEQKTLPKYIQIGVSSGNSNFLFHSKKGILYSQSMETLESIVNSIENSVELPKEIKDFVLSLPESYGTAVIFKPSLDFLDSNKVFYNGHPFKLMKSLLSLDKDFENVQVNFEQNGKEVEAFDFKENWKEDKFIEDKIFTVSSSVETEEKHPIKFIFQVGWSSDKFDTDSDGSVNLLKTPSGKHINLVQTGIGQAFGRYNSLLKYQDSRYGMRLFVLNLAIEPLFNSQDKTKLSKWEDKGYDERKTIQAISDSFYKVMKENQDYFDLLIQRILEYKKATDKLSNIELLKSKVVMGDDGDRKRIQSGEMSRVYECTSNASEKRELYITEGLSASGNIILCRNKLFQSVLPLKGKLINTSGFDEEKLVSNKEVLAIINTIGCGIGGITDISKSRYGKVIIGTDMDDDGCLTGDTLIPLLDGRTVPISELENEEEFWVYSCTEDGQIVPGRGHSARITKTVDTLYEITLDDGSIIRCTNNHPFMLRTGEFVQADNLSEGQSLMPFYREDRENNSCFVKSIKIIQLDNPIEVWDITVDQYHNFALESGCFVHNSHIANLIIGLFMQHCPDLVKAGMLYKLEAPYYRVTDKKGKVSYFYHDQKHEIDFEKCNVDKLKGLGSYNEKESKEFLCDPKSRKLIQIEYSEENEFDVKDAVSLLYSGTKRKQLMIDTGIFIEGQIK